RQAKARGGGIDRREAPRALEGHRALHLRRAHPPGGNPDDQRGRRRGHPQGEHAPSQLRDGATGNEMVQGRPLRAPLPGRLGPEGHSRASRAADRVRPPRTARALRGPSMIRFAITVTAAEIILTVGAALWITWSETGE